MAGAVRPHGEPGAGRGVGEHLRLALENAQRHAAGAVEGDDGPGVAPEDRERILERFVRLDEARSRDAGGAGLGLAVARDVVLRHGGSLTVGGGPGEGAVFRARLPRAK